MQILSVLGLVSNHLENHPGYHDRKYLLPTTYDGLPEGNIKTKGFDALLHPGRLTWNMSSWRFGRSFSFPNGWFVGSMLIFQGVGDHRYYFHVSPLRASEILIDKWPGVPNRYWYFTPFSRMISLLNDLNYRPLVAGKVLSFFFVGQDSNITDQEPFWLHLQIHRCWWICMLHRSMYGIFTYIWLMFMVNV